MCDAFLVLAHIQDDNVNSKSPSGGVPSCFLVPRWLPNGERNPFYLQRLKDKLGNRSNASSEVEFNNTQGVRINEPVKSVSIISITLLVASGQRTRRCQNYH